MTKKRPSLRQEQQEATRRRLLAAARNAFIESGFNDATVDKIVKEANTSRATFYLHFANKTEALLATWTEVNTPELAALFSAYDAKADFSDISARTWLSGIVNYWEEHAASSLAAYQALSLHPELNRAWVAGMEAVAGNMTNLRAALGGGRAARALVIANLIQVEHALYFWTHGGLPFDRDELIASLARAWAINAPNPSQLPNSERGLVGQS